jgi:hypothetical protein
MPEEMLEEDAVNSAAPLDHQNSNLNPAMRAR